MILCHVNSMKPWFHREDYYRIPYFLLWYEVYVDIKSNGWTITMVSVSICIITSPFPEPLSEISFSENFTGQTQFEVKLLPVFIHSEEAQLVHEISPIGCGTAFLEYPTCLWNHFLYYSLKIACNTVPMSLLSEDIVHIQQYPQLEIHSQILLPLLWSWRGQHCCLKVSSNEE